MLTCALPLFIFRYLEYHIVFSVTLTVSVRQILPQQEKKASSILYYVLLLKQMMNAWK